MKLGLGLWLSGTAAQGGGTPSLEPLTRLDAIVTYGSSSMQGIASTATQDENLNTVPAAYQNKTMQTAWYNATLPTNPATSPTITNHSAAGTDAATILSTMQTDATGGVLTGVDIIYQFAGNINTVGGETDATVWASAKQADAVLASNGAALPSGKIFHMVASSGNQFYDANVRRVFYRHQKRLKNTPDTLKGVQSMDDPLYSWTGSVGAPAILSTDIEKQRALQRPFALAGNNPANPGNYDHCNGMGLMVMGQPTVPVIEAWSGGPAFFPLNDYWGRVTGAGQYICDLSYVGSLTGCTLGSSDARFAVTVSGGGIPQLSLTGAAPSAGLVQMNVTVAKSGFTTRNYPIRVYVSARAEYGVPARVSIQNRLVMMLDKSQQLFAGTTRKFSAVVILSFDDDDGNDPTGPASGASDTRNHYLYTNGAINIFRNANGKWQFNGADSSSALVFSSGASGGPLHRITHGTRALFMWYDSDAGIGKWYITAGIGVAAQGPTNMSTINGGTGTIDAARSTTQTNIFSGASTVTGSTALTMYFRGKSYLLWMAADYIDFSNSANRALFVTEGAAEPTPVALGTNGAAAGVTPRVCIQGDAAEIMMGAMQDTTDYDALFGGCNGRNHGAGGNLLSYCFGTTTSIVGNLTTL